MKALHKLWVYWRHGAVIAILYGLGVATAFLGFFILGAILNGAAGLFGYGMAEDAWFDLALALFWVWVPIGLGSVARYVSTDDILPEDARSVRKAL